jgi:hypothetical protein
MSRLTYLRAGPYAGRNILLSDGDATAALADGWAWVEQPQIGWTPETWDQYWQTEVIGTSLDDWLAKIADPAYSVEHEEDGTWTPAAEGKGKGNGPR